MKISELEDSDQLVTKEWLAQTLKAELMALELRLMDRMIQSERGQRAWIAGLYAVVIGAYAMIVAAIYINHFWR